jgi:hypothetical protein
MKSPSPPVGAAASTRYMISREGADREQQLVVDRLERVVSGRRLGSPEIVRGLAPSMSRARGMQPQRTE